MIPIALPSASFYLLLTVSFFAGILLFGWLLALAVSNGARAAELLGLEACDVDWGNQLVRVIRKGTRAEQWLPGSPDAFVWLRLYLAGIDRLEPADRLWVTLRRRAGTAGLVRAPMTYETLRSMHQKLKQEGLEVEQRA